MNAQLSGIRRFACAAALGSLAGALRPAAAQELERFHGPAVCVAVSPDAKFVLAGGDHDDPEIAVWNLETRKRLDRLAGHKSDVVGLFHSRDGTTLVSVGGFDRLVQFRDAKNFKLRRSQTLPAVVTAAALSPDGATLAVGFGGDDSVCEIRLYAADDGKEISPLFRAEPFDSSEYGGLVKGLWFSADGKVLSAAIARGNHPGEFRVWDLPAGKARPALPLEQRCRAYALSPDGRTLAVGVASAGDGHVQLWNVAAGSKGPTLKGHTYTPSALAFSPDGKTLATGAGDREIRLWDSATGKPAGVHHGHEHAVRSLAFSPDGKWLASADGKDTRVWSLAPQKEPVPFRGTAFVRFLPDGRSLLTKGTDNTADLWDLADQDVRRRFWRHRFEIGGAALSADGRTAVSFDRASVKVWTPGESKERLTLAGRGRLVAAGMSADGKTVVGAAGYVRNAGHTPDRKTGSNSCITVWDGQTGKVRRDLTSGYAGVRAAAVSPDGRWVAAFYNDHVIRLWDLNANSEPAVLRPDNDVISLTFSPDSRTLASVAFGHMIVLWDIERRRERALVGTDKDEPSSAAFSPDGRVLASGGRSGQVRLYNVSTNVVSELASFSAQREGVAGLAFSADGKTLATVSDRMGGLLWDVSIPVSRAAR